jgi:hypothetical protein
MLAPEKRETILGAAEVRDTFKITKVGTIAGCYVIDGVIERKGRGRVIRDGIMVYDGEFSSLKRFKDDAKEVREGFECGIGIANFNDVKVGDVIECYSVHESYLERFLWWSPPRPGTYHCLGVRRSRRSAPSCGPSRIGCGAGFSFLSRKRDSRTCTPRQSSPWLWSRPTGALRRLFWTKRTGLFRRTAER